LTGAFSANQRKQSGAVILLIESTFARAAAHSMAEANTGSIPEGDLTDPASTILLSLDLHIAA
jgi:hypothetical protein